MQNSIAFFPNGTKRLNWPCFYRLKTSNSPIISIKWDFSYLFTEISNFTSTSIVIGKLLSSSDSSERKKYIKTKLVFFFTLLYYRGKVGGSYENKCS